jgi:Uma2 family endonuclease
MSAALHTSMSEYLAASYRPDREFVDGKVVERNVGERSHSHAQSRLLELLLQGKSRWAIEAFVELRVQVAPERFRLPDVCALKADAPYEEIVTHPPLLCVEILSKDDRMAEMLERVDDYLKMGVPCVWVIDPRSKRGFEHTAGSAVEAKEGVLRVASTEIAVQLTSIFEAGI